MVNIDNIYITILNNINNICQMNLNDIERREFINNELNNYDIDTIYLKQILSIYDII